MAFGAEQGDVVDDADGLGGAQEGCGGFVFAQFGGQRGDGEGGVAGRGDALCAVEGG
ncbi:hypothetical protein ACQP1G_32265 [Nocardia sp. CA-107356]|uniref:hypothetical protein n=1 Tax=Nocardia sp. CA-107356 TaxID=3239972 RepID=UPI003D90CAA6